ARDSEGTLIEGLLEADSERDLAAKLADINIVLVESKSVKSGEAKSFYLGKVKRREIVLFTNHLATSVEAGVPVVQAMADYASEIENQRVKKIVGDVERQVLAGTTLSEAMSKHSEAFSELYVAIVATGEATGNLDLVLRDLVGFLEWQEDLIAQIKKASIYPAFLVSMIIGVVVIMMTVTLPQFIPILKGFNVELPAPTRILIATSEFFENYSHFIVLGLILFFINFKVTYKTIKGRYFWDTVKLKMPLLGPLQHKIVLSKFAHYFSILYSAGIGIIESFNIIERVVGNDVLRRAVKRSIESIQQGGSIYDSLKKEKTFPNLVLRMIQVGESTGNLDKSLQKVSQYYDKEVPASIDKMFAVFEPLLIIFMGVVVLFIALAIFLPIYKLTSTIGAQ
ncbi:MAG: type II secretion system F family protein, partial [bacterium]|nr:type II secretion system F family protein [bacterium]